jgi:type I restriction enzyme S subunit
MQKEFVTKVRQLGPLAKQGEACRAHLDRLWEVLLHRAFTGELTAKWREAHAEELRAEMEEQAKALGLAEVPS